MALAIDKPTARTAGLRCCSELQNSPSSHHKTSCSLQDPLFCPCFHKKYLQDYPICPQKHHTFFKLSSREDSFLGINHTMSWNTLDHKIYVFGKVI